MAAGPNGYVGPAILVIFALERNDGIRNIVVLSVFALTLGMGMAAVTHADWIIADSNDDAEEKPLRGGEMELGSSDLELGIEGTVPDKVQTDGTIITGTIWKFTVPDYLIVGDFDSYTDNDAAYKELQKVHDWLASINQAAARSLEEGFEQTLTVNKLGLPAELRQLFGSTNMIESCFSRADDLCRNVKRWRNANMAWRWGGTVLLEAERRFHRIRGYRQMPLLVTVLSSTVDRKEVVA